MYPPADPAGVGNQIARIDLAKGELLDAALVHVGRGHVAVQNTVGADKRRIDAQRAQGILGRGPHKGGGAAAVHAAHQAQLAILARLEQAKGRKRIGHIDESQLVGDSESANAISRRLRSLSQLDTQRNTAPQLNKLQGRTIHRRINDGVSAGII